MSEFKIVTKSSDAGRPMSRDESVSGTTMVQSQIGNRPLRPVRMNFDLDLDEHRCSKMRAVEVGISIADFVHGLTRKEISWLMRNPMVQPNNSTHEKNMAKMMDAKRATLKRLIVHTMRDNGQGRRVVDFLLAWQNPGQCGGFDITVVWGLDDEIAEDVVVVFSYAARSNHYPDTLGYGSQFEATVRKRRPELVSEEGQWFPGGRRQH